MAPLSESTFRSLLADCERSAFADFVADLWRARGREGERVGDRLAVDGRELRPVVELDSAPPEGVVPVTATAPPADADGSVVGPGDLYQVLLYDVPRERAAELFEAHFDRPLADRSDDGESAEESSADGTAEPTARPATAPGEGPGSSPRPTETNGGPSDEHTTAEDADAQRRSGRAAAVLARARGFRRRLADPRVKVAGAALLVVLAASLGALFVYQPDAQTSDPPFAVDDQPAPVDGSYRIVGQARVVTERGERYYELSRTYAPGDPAVGTLRLILGGPDDQMVVERYSRGNRSYVRQRWTDGAAFQRQRERVGDREGVVRTYDWTRTIYEASDDTGGVTASARGGIPVSRLTLLPYERAGNATYEGRDAVRYEPTTGWTEVRPGPHSDRRTYRVRSASGEVLVDPETGALLSADVEATVVTAETWADVFTEPDLEFDVEYRVETDVERPRVPPWVQGLQATAETPPATNATDTDSPATNATA